jgi:hypothetical protein
MTEAPDPNGDALEDEQERWQVLTQLEDWLEQPMQVLSFIWLSQLPRFHPARFNSHLAAKL